VNITYSKQAAKIIDGMDVPTKQRIKLGVEGIPNGDIKPLEGYSDGTYRLRIGKFRIVFVIDGDTVVVRKIGSRGDIYK